ncbi:ATP-binding protein [Paenibacillus sp. GCM10027627]|uniref:ATP-binding protein n=1 Tax=unclassified Paenibacillus TaxID=185978 RepID=UPI003632CBAF
MKVWDRLARLLWHSVVGKLWATIMLLVAVVLLILGVFLLQYIDIWFDDNSSHDIKVLFVITAIIGFLLSTFFAFFLSAKIQQPLLQLKNAADSVSQGNYNTRVDIQSSDEIGQLANTFNHMTEQLDKLIHDLNHEKNHLASVLRSMGDSVITFDAEGQVILTNPSGHLLIKGWASLEYAWEEEQQEDAPFFPSVPMPLRELYQSVMKEGRDQTGKVHVHSSVWSVVMAPLQSGEIVRGAVAVIRNVTEEHKLDKLRRDFVANISHEIRTPLSMLQGYSEALLDDIVASPEERKELVQVIYDESLRMGRLVNDFLDIARMEAGHVDMHFQEVDLRNVLKRVHRKFQVYAKEREVALLVELPVDQPLIMSQADEDRLEQVLTNLMDNALRHTPAGKAITLSGENQLLSGKSFIQLKVQDEGVGIPQEDVPYIFERFYKADKARTRGSSVGTGLGLAIVKNLIDLHRGKIVVDSFPGAGTAFTLLLPVEAHD